MDKIQNLIKTNKAYTLVEIMIAVVIIGILSAIAVPNAMLYQRRAAQKEGIALLNTLYGNMRITRLQTYTFIGDFVSISFRPDGEIPFRVSIETAASAIAVPQNWYCDRSCISTSVVNCQVFTAAGNCNNDTQGNFNTWTEGATAAAHTAAFCVPGTTANTFTACASANLGGATNSDISIDESKQIRILRDGTVN